MNFPSIPAGTCQSGSRVTSESLDDDLILVTPGVTWPTGLTVTAHQQTVGSSSFVLAVCNPTGAAIDPDPTAFQFIVIRT